MKDVLAAAAGGHPFHGGFGILIMLVVGGLIFGIVRLTNRRARRANAGTMSLLGIPVPAERRRALARVGAIVDEPAFTPT